MFLPCSSESMSSILSAISHLCLLDGPGVLWLAVGLPHTDHHVDQSLFAILKTMTDSFAQRKECTASILSC